LHSHSLDLVFSGTTANDRLSALGLELNKSDNGFIVDTVGFGSAAEKAGVGFDWEITGVKTKTNRPPKELVYIPAILLALFVAWLQRRRMAASVTA